MKAKMVFKALNGMLPCYLSEKFPRFSTLHSRNARNDCGDLILPRVKHSYGQRLFAFSAARLWNSLPDEKKRTAFPWAHLSTKLGKQLTRLFLHLLENDFVVIDMWNNYIIYMAILFVLNFFNVFVFREVDYLVIFAPPSIKKQYD